MTEYLYDPPIDPVLDCRHCGDPLIALGRVHSGGFTIGGLAEYRWAHANRDTICRPTTVAQPFDGWKATTAVQRVEQERRDAEDARIDAMEETS